MAGHGVHTDCLRRITYYRNDAVVPLCTPH
jgi:hypothetical protein